MKPTIPVLSKKNSYRWQKGKNLAPVKYEKENTQEL